MVPGLHTPLLGRPAIESLGLITRVASIGLTGDQIPVQFLSLFKGLRKLKGEFKAELERMVQLGVISPVKEPTEWCAAVAWWLFIGWVGSIDYGAPPPPPPPPPPHIFWK